MVIPIETQGYTANRSGRVAEELLAAMLSVRYDIDRQVVVGRTIYGGELRADLLVRGMPDFPSGLVFESKWQDTPGTVDEKLPYLVLNIKTCYPCPVIVVMEGGGCRPGAVDWIHRQIDGEHLIAVFNLTDLAAWIVRGNMTRSSLTV